jgi:hypothetical protein
VSVFDPPLQIELDEGLIETVGELLTLTVDDAEAEHPPAFVPVTE